MTNLVLDASAGVDLLLDTQAGRSLHHLIPARAEWWVPEHYFIEVAGALRRAEMHDVAPKARVATAFASVTTAPLRRVQVGRFSPRHGRSARTSRSPTPSTSSWPSTSMRPS